MAVEHDSSLCEEMDKLGGEPLVDNSVLFLEPRASKKSKVESDEIHISGDGNLVSGLKESMF